MNLNVDDWHFRPMETETLAIDLFLASGQHALLEVNPMKYQSVTNGQIPEMIVFCEFLGEKLSGGVCPSRWISRPPNHSCPWSKVELPPALMEQIKQRLANEP
ncbi:MAG: hypothetical protein O2960_14650 [Verrucomicrobia bacterium]|nr:hypothetical protein [Verrucomicrobiota bacterium]